MGRRSISSSIRTCAGPGTAIGAGLGLLFGLMLLGITGLLVGAVIGAAIGAIYELLSSSERAG
jgi:uncharacterized membrane protein